MNSCYFTTTKPFEPDNDNPFYAKYEDHILIFDFIHTSVLNVYKTNL